MGGRFIRATALAASTVRSAFPGHQVDGRRCRQGDTERLAHTEPGVSLPPLSTIQSHPERTGTEHVPAVLLAHQGLPQDRDGLAAHPRRAPAVACSGAGVPALGWQRFLGHRVIERHVTSFWDIGVICPVWSKNLCSLALVVCEQSAKPLTTLYRAAIPGCWAR